MATLSRSIFKPLLIGRISSIWVKEEPAVASNIVVGEIRGELDVTTTKIIFAVAEVGGIAPEIDED